MSVYPEIVIDDTKCTTPYDCKRCLQICPQACFIVDVVKMEKFKETDPKEPHAYELKAMFADKCVVCNECIEVCPQDALRIISPTGV